jgi:two-component system chemotaxis response regulator CheB
MTPIRIFVVDDPSVVRRVMESVLAGSGLCQVIGSAGTVAEARDAIAALQPDVVALDMNMPEGDRIDYLDELRRGDGPAVVIVSAAARPGSPKAAEALARGAYACFDKVDLVREADALIGLLRQAAGQGRERAAG